MTEEKQCPRCWGAKVLSLGEYIAETCRTCEGSGRVPVVPGWRPSDGVTHDGQPVVPYQCVSDTNHPGLCLATFENPCMHSPAGKIMYRDAPNITGGVDADLCPGDSDLLLDAMRESCPQPGSGGFHSDSYGDDGDGACKRCGISPLPEPRNPEHDSLFTRFEQLETTLDKIRDAVTYKTLDEALTILRLIRAQVLK